MLPIARTAEITATVDRLFIARTRDEGRRGRDTRRRMEPFFKLARRWKSLMSAIFHEDLAKSRHRSCLYR
jgi:hypothetical protein